jgi:hypothetical protein
MSVASTAIAPFITLFHGHYLFCQSAHVFSSALV